jgi:hypothetical protein
MSDCCVFYAAVVIRDRSTNSLGATRVAAVPSHALPGIQLRGRSSQNASYVAFRCVVLELLFVVICRVFEPLGKIGLITDDASNSTRDFSNSTSMLALLTLLLKEDGARLFPSSQHEQWQQQQTLWLQAQGVLHGLLDGAFAFVSRVVCKNWSPLYPACPLTYLPVQEFFSTMMVHVAAAHRT